MLPTNKENCVIHYFEDAFSANRPDLKGRHSAGAGFLRGLARNLEADAMYALARGPAARDFADTVRKSGWNREVRAVGSVIDPLVKRVGTVFCPFPNLSDLSWPRQQASARDFSIVGITHTICSDTVLQGFYETMVAPHQPWDAIICTSGPAKAAIAAHLDRAADFLRARFGATRVPRPELPVIPLGIETADFAPPDAAHRRAAMRARLGLDDDTVAALFLGRLTFHAKAHPLPMYVALNKAAERSGRRVVLLMAGRFPNVEIEDQFRKVAQAEAPSIRTVFVDGRDDRAMADVWHAADFFISLSDNVQETFGLTVIEAMAAGLPVVASDWDGYRDTVAHGTTGFLIPTLGCPPGADDVVGRQYFAGGLTFDRYIGYASLMTPVDVPLAVDACHSLIVDRERRARMGAAGRDRARRLFDWTPVIAQYQALWAELRARRENSQAHGDNGRLLTPPLETFGCFPTAPADGTLCVRPTASARADLNRRRQQGMNSYGGEFLFRAATPGAILDLLDRSGAMTLDAITMAMPGTAPAETARALLWMLKMDVLERVR